MKLSLRSVIAAVLLFAIVGLSAFAASFAIEISNSVPSEIAKTASPTLHTVRILLDDDLKLVGQYLNDAAYGGVTTELGSSTDFTGYYHASEELHAAYSPLLTANSSISAVFVVKADDLITHTVYGTLSGNTGAQRLAEKEGIRQAVIDLITGGDIRTDTWDCLPMPGTMILYQAIYWAGCYNVCLIDLNAAVSYYSSLYDIPGELVFARDGQILTNYDSGAAEILFDETVSEYALSQAAHNVLLLQERSSVLDLICLVPIGNLAMNLTALQWMAITITGLMLLVFLVSFAYLRWNFIRPMNGLMAAMERIRAGDLDALPDEEYNSQEFSVLYDTFQKMITSLKEMKIQAYEKDLENQRARMNALRLQIRPHFYLNCLKAIYASAAMGRFDQVQDRIMYLSRHLRYCFSLRGDSVPLRDELTLCKNYLEMFNIGQPRHNEFCLHVEEELLDFQIPPMTLLTAVENSAKYFHLEEERHPGKTLRVVISAAALRMGSNRIVNICVKDNGPGFSAEAMDLIRRPNADHVGISNIAQQMKFFFGPTCEVAFTNQDGAQIDFFIPLAAEEKEAEHEPADC